MRLIEWDGKEYINIEFGTKYSTCFAHNKVKVEPQLLPQAHGLYCFAVKI